MSTAPAPFAKQESGVSLGRTDTLPRYALCQDFMRELTLPGNGRAIIYAAPGSGKTSFGALLKDYLVTPTDNSTGRTQFQQDFNYGFPVVAHHISLRLAIGSNPRDYLRGAAGTNKVIFTGGVGPLFAPPAAGLKIIILDEGQMSYGDEWNDLWTEIMDARCDGQTGVCVVLLAAYGRRVITDIPPTPITFPVAYNGDFLKFSRSEVHDLYTRLNTTLSFAMPDEVSTAIHELSDGIPLLVTQLYHRVREPLKTASEADVQANAMKILTSHGTVKYAFESRAIIDMNDVWPLIRRGATSAGATRDEEWAYANRVTEQVLLQALHGEYEMPYMPNPIFKSVHTTLVKCGILEYSHDEIALKYSCPLQAMRIFTTLCGAYERAPHVVPADLQCLVEQALWNLNPGVLRHSLGVGVGDIPLERTWQMEVYRALTEIAPVGCTVSPDVGWKFGVDGYVDFYMHGPNFRWMLELLREGHGLGEHAGRFRGQGVYTRIPHDDYLVLDFYALGRWQMPRARHEDEHVWRFGYFQDLSGGILSRNGRMNMRITFRGTSASRFEQMVAWLTDSVTTILS